MNTTIRQIRFLGCFFGITAIFSTGCTTSRTYRLPALQAEKVSVIHTDSAGTIQAHATGVKITEAYITAETARWEVAYPFWHDIVIAEGFRQKRTKADDDK